MNHVPLTSLSPSSLPLILSTAALATLLLALFKSLQSYLSLRHIPGPKAAALTNLVRRSWAKSGRIHEIHLRVHADYGSVVRVGPNAVLVSQPRAIESIFGFKARMKKSEFYNALMPRMKGGAIPDVFATLDEDVHRQMRRPVANLYSIGNLVSFEPLITSTLRHFFARIDELFTDRGNTSFDMYDWLQFFTFDVIGEVTFSRRLGFLDAGGDIEGVIEANRKYFEAAAPNTQMPWLDYLWKDNPLLPAGSKKNLVAEFSFARIHERMSLTPEEREGINQRDFLSCFIREKEKDSDLPASAVPTWTNSNIQAGVDTTSILESALFYHLLKNPTTLATLRAEIDAAAKAGRISEFVSWKESQTLPYLQACIHEASRLHPPICFPIERVVGKEGLQIDGFAIPPETRISMSPWTVHREKWLYGEDAERWRPERWLVGEEEKKAMYNSLLTFGAGHRSCLGKNLSYFQIFKLVPSLLQKYDLELVRPNEEWKIENHWFAQPSGFEVRISRRK